MAAAVTVAGLAALLMFGLQVGLPARLPATLVAVTFSHRPKPSPPPPPAIRTKAPSSAATGRPSPRNVANRATPVVAQPVPIILPPPVVVAPAAGSGAAANNGAAPLPGPGQGAGGYGNGLGGGGSGGNGADEFEPSVIGPRRIAGRLSMQDLPEGLLPPGREFAVTVLYRVGADGLVSDCQIDRSSGIADLDKLACRLIEQRFRFRPARGRSGRAVPSRVIETHSWYAEPAPESTRSPKAG